MRESCSPGWREVVSVKCLTKNITQSLRLSGLKYRQLDFKSSEVIISVI